jgi:hypothetical protein
MNVGDRLVLRTGMLRITFDVRDMRPPRKLTFDVGLALWCQQPRTDSDHTAINAHSNRVTFT